tara:strand:- start:10541 stop:10747 length:207 start_codon:yes stop_codon:yes gene_type:complete
MFLSVKKNVLTFNRLLIFLLIVIGVIFNSDFCAILAAAYWLWLPNIERIECSVLHVSHSEIKLPENSD